MRLWGLRVARRDWVAGLDSPLVKATSTPPAPAHARPAWSARQLTLLRRHWPWLTVAAVLAAGLFVLYLDHWRKGLFIVGSASLLGAIFRAVLPARRVALLVVRSRPFDVATLVVLGLVLDVLSAAIPTIKH
jgi:hypothetical protein